MTAFEEMVAHLMADPNIGSAAWWLDKAGNGRTAVRVLLRRPALDQLKGKAPSALEQRLLDLPLEAAGAAAGDLVAFNGECWQLGGRPDPDPVGLTARWIALPFTGNPLAFDAAGCPLLTWNGVAWVAGP